MTGAFAGWGVLPLLLLTCGGGASLGYALARLHLADRRVEDIPALRVLLQFVGTFARLADRRTPRRLRRSSPWWPMPSPSPRASRGRMNARHRIASYAVWEVAVFVLNVLAFVLIGLQLRGILSAAGRRRLADVPLCARRPA